MTTSTLFLGVGLILFVTGFAALVLRSSPLHRVLAINVMGIGVFMWLIATAFASGRTDSVPHALVLTGIVVAVSATAFGLALLVRLQGGEREPRDREEGASP